MSAVLIQRERAGAAVTLTVNGRRVAAEVEPRTHLADFLREGLDLTGTHLGCEHGVCGACTLLLDGEPARSCLTLASSCDGASVTTIEGLDDDEIATELRAAFTREHALQCGYCTPGMLIAARDLVIRLPDADERRVRLGLSGNLCRCTGYVGIVRAIRAVITERRARGVAAEIPARPLGPIGAWQPSGQGISPAVAAAEVAPPMPATGSRTVPVAFDPAHSFEQSFTVPFPPDVVFAMFGRVEEVAACLPGATISSHSAPDGVEGAIRVKLGPVAATFRGAATIERDEESRSGRILGLGQETGGRSSTQGSILYRVGPGPTTGSARIDLTVGYTLKGALAQFGRPGLVRDLAGRIVAQFAAHLEARLAGRPADTASASLDTGSLLTSLVWSWLAAARLWLTRYLSPRP